MKRTIAPIIGFITAITMLTGCTINDTVPSKDKEPQSVQADEDKTEDELNEQKETKRTESNSKKSETEEQNKDYVEQMTIEEKVAQMLYVGVQGTTLSQNERDMISKGQVGGVILLGGNIDSTEQLSSYVSSIKEANNDNPIPLFVGVDEEGGPVSRIPAPIKNLPSSEAIGEVGSAALSNQVGSLLARRVKSFGFNMNFAPVLDINNNPNNEVIGNRSFGATPSLVSDLGIPTMKGIQSENIIPVIKHFPGHGDTSVDSHINLPTIHKSLQKLRNFELVPFQKAIEEGAEVVMTAHILFPSLDKKFPATLSKEIITGLLREKMNFDGLVITDDMSMGAITQNYGGEEAAVRSIQAGADMLLITKTHDGNYRKIKETLIHAVNEGTITNEQLNQSVARILRVKNDYQLKNTTKPKLQESELNQDTQEIIDQVRKTTALH